MKEYPELYEKETGDDGGAMPTDTENATSETNVVITEESTEESKASAPPSTPLSNSDNGRSGVDLPTMEKSVVESKDSTAEEPKAVTTENATEQGSKTILPPSTPLLNSDDGTSVNEKLPNTSSDAVL